MVALISLSAFKEKQANFSQVLNLLNTLNFHNPTTHYLSTSVKAMVVWQPQSVKTLKAKLLISTLFTCTTFQSAFAVNDHIEMMQSTELTLQKVLSTNPHLKSTLDFLNSASCFIKDVIHRCQYIASIL